MARASDGGLSKVWRAVVNWTVMLVLWVATAVLLAVWNLPALSDWRSARNRYEEAHVRVERQRQVVARLETEKEALAVDLKALERAAREEYLLLKPGEEVYVFEERRLSRP